MKEITITITETDEGHLHARAVELSSGKILFDQFAPSDMAHLNFYYNQGALSCELISGTYINPKGGKQ